jgi:hypothetical protein
MNSPRFLVLLDLWSLKRRKGTTPQLAPPLAFRVFVFCESGPPSSRLLASRVPGTWNAKMMTHDNVPPAFRDVRALPFPFRTSSGRNVEIHGACSFGISRFAKSGCVRCRCFLEPPVAEKLKWPDTLSFGISRFVKFGYKGYPCSLEPTVAEKLKCQNVEMLWHSINDSRKSL